MSTLFFANIWKLAFYVLECKADNCLSEQISVVCFGDSEKFIREDQFVSVKEPFFIDFLVRDYECDMQGVVNNAVYQNYLEHARHEYIKGLGLDFSELACRGINLVVIRTELDYKRSLRSGDRFQVSVVMEKLSPLRFVFLQELHRLPECELVLKARIVGTVLNKQGRPQFPDEVAAVFNNAVAQR